MSKLFCLLLLLSLIFLACNTEDKNIPDSDSKLPENKNPGTPSAVLKPVEKDNFTVNTEDGLKIKGEYYYNDLNEKQPAVILIHQFRSDKSEWKKEFIDALINMNYKVVTYDIRNHGESDKVNIDDYQLLYDGNQTPKDLKAVFEWINNQEGIDVTRTAVIGTSIGAALAVYSKYNLGVKVVVCVSAGRKTFEGLTGFKEEIMGAVIPRFNNVLFFAGENDGNSLNDTKYIIENFVMEPFELKVYQTNKHGKSLIKEYPEINEIILDWLKKYL